MYRLRREGHHRRHRGHHRACTTSRPEVGANQARVVIPNLQHHNHQAVRVQVIANHPKRQAVAVRVQVVTASRAEIRQARPVPQRHTPKAIVSILTQPGK